MSIAWLGRLVFWIPIVLAVCVARQVTQSYLPRVLKPKESELDAKARKIQQKVEEKLARKAARCQVNVIHLFFFFVTDFIRVIVPGKSSFWVD